MACINAYCQAVAQHQRFFCNVFLLSGTLIFVFRDTSPFGTMVTIGGHYYGAGIARLIYKE